MTSRLGRLTNRFSALVLTVMVTAVTTLFAASASPASAEECGPTNPTACLPGQLEDRVDCLNSPTPAMPDTGATSFFVSAPDAPPDDGRAHVVSRYDEYGYAGLQYHTYDLGCGPDGAIAPDALINTSIANMIFGVSTFLVGLANALREYAYDPDSMWGWTDGLVESASRALYERVFNVLGVVVVIIVGAWLVWSARRGEMSNSATIAGWALLVMVITTAVAAWPLKAATTADKALTGALGVVNAALHPGDTVPCGSRECVDDRTPQRRGSGTVTDIVLYRQWLAGTLGSADSETAEKYGDQLYIASAFTWEEAKRTRSKSGDTKEVSERKKAERKALIESKQDDWKVVAAKIKEEDPDAYEYLTGRQGTSRIGAAFAALIAAVTALPFDIMASVLILAAFLIIRLAVAFLPAIATVAILRPAAGPLRGLFRTVVAAILNCVIFGMGASVFLLAIELITKTRSLAGWQQILLIWLTGLVLWLLLRPFRRLTQLTGKDPFAQLAGGIGSMHKRVFGDMKQLAFAAGGSYLGDVAALEANDERRARQADSGQGRPESWSRQRPTFLGATNSPPPGARQERPETSPATGTRTGGTVPPHDRRTVFAPGSTTTSRDHASDAVRDADLRRPRAADPLPVETEERYPVYRPERSHRSVSADSALPSAAAARVSHAATTVSQAANAAREAALAAGVLASASDRRRV